MIPKPVRRVLGRRRPRKVPLGKYVDHKKPWVSLFAILESCNSFVNPYCSARRTNIAGDVCKIIGDSVTEGIFGEMWPIINLRTEESSWIQRANIYEFLTKRRKSWHQRFDDEELVNLMIKQKNNDSLCESQNVQLRQDMAKNCYLGISKNQTVDSIHVPYVALKENDKGIILKKENRGDWGGFVVLFEKAGMCWVEWYKIVPITE